MLLFGAGSRIQIGLLLGADLRVGPIERPGIEEDHLLAWLGELTRIDIESEQYPRRDHPGETGGDPVAARAGAPEVAQILEEGAGAGWAGQRHRGEDNAGPPPTPALLPYCRLCRHDRAMTRFLSAALTLAALSAPAFAEDRHYAVGDFDRVIAEGPYVVRLVTGRATSAIAHGSREALDRMSLDVQGQMLRIRRNRGAWSGGNGRDPGTVTIDLTTRSVRSLRLIGPVRLDADNVRGLRIELSVEGSGTLRATRLNADALSLALLGSGSLDVAGAARTVAGTFQGTGDVAAPALIAHNATIASTTSGAVALTVNGPATIVNNGVGNVRILGRAVCTISGTAADQVRCGGGSD